MRWSCSAPNRNAPLRAGLAYAGRVDERLKTFRQEVASIAHGEKLSVAINASAHELYEPVAKALFDIAQESTLETVKLWRKGRHRHHRRAEPEGRAENLEGFCGG